jgi:predicted transglutaminase-like cysteine proteinase
MWEGRKFEETARAALAAAALVLAPEGAGATGKRVPETPFVTTVEKASEALPNFARTYGDATPPQDFINFCVRHSSECTLFLGTFGETMQREEGGDFGMLELADINQEVNAFPQISDLELFGVREYWTIADSRGGDCEDLAALKKRLLKDVRGFKPNNLLLTHVLDEKSEGQSSSWCA